MIDLEEFSAGTGGGDIIIASSGKTNNITLSIKKSLILSSLFGWLWRIINTIMDPTMMDIHIATCHTCVHSTGNGSASS